MNGRPLTGYHVLAIFVIGFGIIISVNLKLAFSAVRTFPGLEVANSYVESQSFELRRDAQDALGWQESASYADGVLTLQVTDRDGAPISPALFEATIGRATTQVDDHDLTFDAEGKALIDLAPGRWRLDLRSREGAAVPFVRTLHLELRQ